MKNGWHLFRLRPLLRDEAPLRSEAFAQLRPVKLSKGLLRRIGRRESPVWCALETKLTEMTPERALQTRLDRQQRHDGNGTTIR